MSETLDPSLEALNNCGCCAGTTAPTPATVENSEGLEIIRYRVGTHEQFLQSLLASLSDTQRSALRDLATRDQDDFTIALLDAWAVTADIHTFYQERLANESYVRTARDLGSVLRLARLIGYLPAPGVAAQTWLTFSLDTSPGAPVEVAIDAGTKVQSVPGQDQNPQTFETIESITARREWNALVPQQIEPIRIVSGQTELYLQGTATQLRKGDAILMVGEARRLHPTTYPDKERWDFRILTAVETDSTNERTRVSWEEGLGKAPIAPPNQDVRVYAFRQRTALFGHNAPDPNLITAPSDAIANALFDMSGSLRRWKDYTIRNGLIELEGAHPKIVADSWVALMKPPYAAGFRGYVELYGAKNVSFPSLRRFGMSGKSTRIEPDTDEHLGNNFFGLAETIVFVESEELELAAPPYEQTLAGTRTLATGTASDGLLLDQQTLAPFEGTRIKLDRKVPTLQPGQVLLVTGKRLRVKVTASGAGLTLSDDSGQRSVVLQPEETLVVLAPPAVQSGGTVTWRLQHADGFEGNLDAPVPALAVTHAEKQDPEVSEKVEVKSCGEDDPTEIELAGAGLQRTYDRKTVRVSGNVALATHGETVEEPAGSGNAAEVFQRFVLKQSPLTYLRGGQNSNLTSTLTVSVDGLRWQEVPCFYSRGPHEQVFITRTDDAQKTAVFFGDGHSGARLPTGQQNVRFKYRKGSGLDGLVGAGALTQLLTRPSGVQAVTNPLPAEGADEAEQLKDARRNAPLAVLTLDRVVSLQDYEDFARAYPGIAKALATWTWDGRRRGVFLTVAGPEGADVPATGLGADLTDALRAKGDPFVPLRVQTYRRATFELAGTVIVDPPYERDQVLKNVRAALQTGFAFDARAFGQPVTLSEVIERMHSVAGVRAVDVDHLQRSDLSGPEDPAPRLLAEFPIGGAGGEPLPAELLLLASGNLEEVKGAS